MASIWIATFVSLTRDDKSFCSLLGELASIARLRGFRNQPPSVAKRHLPLSGERYYKLNSFASYLDRHGFASRRQAMYRSQINQKNSLRGKFSIFDLLFQKWIDNLWLNFIINISLNRSRTKLRIINLVNNFLNFSLAKFR